jgi:hypothetical protein
VRRTGNKVELVPLLELLQTLRGRHVGVHDREHRPPVMHGRSGGDTGAGFTVVV